jgi:hypothetical protein
MSNVAKPTAEFDGEVAILYKALAENIGIHKDHGV